MSRRRRDRESSEAARVRDSAGWEQGATVSLVWLEQAVRLQAWVRDSGIGKSAKRRSQAPMMQRAIAG
jgi:hypothetical protein